MTRPAHLQGRLVALVIVGGVLGTGTRQALGLVVPPTGDFPLAIFLINLTGAFVLGALLEALLRSGLDEGWRRGLRLTAGTGFLGGYTTYSSLAVATGQLFGHGRVLLGVAYALGSVVLGVGAAALGIVAGRRLMRRRTVGDRTVRGGAR
ncbi:CrcB family protein [Raineyella sp. LH-20]|uniref:fluoride efflux transporter FluC n=1 Tax=Raineyella sp. LH-20 TaxID=3081204 RepID=UPI002953E024|nr:CrcB family protein [Raineyella sp. LH-20]WOP17238.1 CrcB family protein [Raineyella sp. LH-20]